MNHSLPSTSLREREGKLASVELVAGSLSFYLSQDDWKKGRGRVKGEGFRLYCTTAQSVDRLAEEIRERGGKWLEEPHGEPWGARAFAVADPEGFKVTTSSIFIGVTEGENATRSCPAMPLTERALSPVFPRQ